MQRWIKTIMFNFFKYTKQDRELFQSFLFHETMNNPTLNLDDALSLYIKKHNLMICTCLDEPENISILRTKLQIMEEMLSIEPDFYKQKELTDYVANLHRFVDACNSLTPECLKHMKEQG